MTEILTSEALREQLARLTGFGCIVADPPWPVVRSFGGANWRRGDRQRPNLDYPTMSVVEICALPVAGCGLPDSHLFLWTTQGFLWHAPQVCAAWGFVPVSTLIWCKPRGGFVGGTFYSNVEFLIFARRGHPPMLERINSQWFEHPRGEHSQKPELFQDMIERTSSGPYLELFARRTRPRWTCWGNEVPKTGQERIDNDAGTD
jgi:N6-adenosine-specific RNA methylase IME4